MSDMFRKPNDKLVLLMSFFAALYVTSNILAFKLVEVGPLTLPLGLLAFPFLFLITDTVAEVYGQYSTRRMILNGFMAMIAVLALMQLAVYIPPAGFMEGFPQDAFAAVLGATLRITGGSMVAYLISQYHDVWAFHFWRKKTGGKHLWLRNNLSTFVSQLLDSVIFITIAFAGIYPIAVLWSMILGQWVVKWLIALADTPLCYLLVAWAKKDDIKE